MDVIAAESAVDRWRGVENDVRTPVVAAGAAGFAGGLGAGYAALEGDAVSDLQTFDVAACLDDDAGALVAEAEIGFDDRVADASCFPEVNVAFRMVFRSQRRFRQVADMSLLLTTTYTCSSHMYQTVVRSWLRQLCIYHVELMFGIGFNGYVLGSTGEDFRGGRHVVAKRCL